MSDIERAIEEDQKKHPKCGYSKQFSKEVMIGWSVLSLVPVCQREDEVRGGPADFSSLFGKATGNPSFSIVIPRSKFIDGRCAMTMISITKYICAIAHFRLTPRIRVMRRMRMRIIITKDLRLADLVDLADLEGSVDLTDVVQRSKILSRKMWRRRACGTWAPERSTSIWSVHSKPK